MSQISKRLFDVLGASLLLMLLSPIAVAVAALVRFTSPGPVVYNSVRAGRSGTLFKMQKFRTMRVGTPELATHLLANPDEFISPVGSFLRRSSLDELPQLVNVIRGQMSLVGPRPALFNQFDLIELRSERGVDSLRPGITGLAQVKGRDRLSTEQKVELDATYLEEMSLIFDLKIILWTLQSVISSRDIGH